jgi:hypothetical protein
LQQAQVARLDVFIVDLEQQVAAFKALPIERDAEDPDVPQPELVAPAAVRRDPTVRGLTASGALVQGLVRNVPPPMPPPELIAADR